MAPNATTPGWVICRRAAAASQQPVECRGERRSSLVQAGRARPRPMSSVHSALSRGRVAQTMNHG